MAVKGYFYNATGLNDKEHMYNGKDMNEDKAPFYKEGVVFGHLAVTAGEGMEIKVDGGSRTGYAYINLHTIHNTTELSLQIGQASGNLPRIDRVVLRNDETERNPSIYILKGAYSNTPQPADLTNTEEIQEKCLAEIYVAAGAVEITQADITDTRADSSVCGFIASQFEEIDFSQFAMQFNAWFTQKKDSFGRDYAAFIAEYRELVDAFVTEQQIFTDKQKEEWGNWFSSAQDILVKTETGELLEEVKRLYEKEIHPVSEMLGDTDISDIGDGTLTGAINALDTGLGGFSFYPEKLTQAQYDALPEEKKATPGLIFVIMKE